MMVSTALPVYDGFNCSAGIFIFLLFSFSQISFSELFLEAVVFIVYKAVL